MNNDSRVDRVVFETPIVKVGVLRCPIEHPKFKQPGPTENYALVFPRAPISVDRSDGTKFVADPATAAVWNRHQLYSRQAVSPEGAVSDWFAIDWPIVLDIVRTHDASVENTPERPFRFSHLHTPPDIYLF